MLFHFSLFSSKRQNIPHCALNHFWWSRTRPLQPAGVHYTKVVRLLFDDLPCSMHIPGLENRFLNGCGCAMFCKKKRNVREH